jgi:hypothetical protein
LKRLNPETVHSTLAQCRLDWFSKRNHWWNSAFWCAQSWWFLWFQAFCR